MALNTGLGLRRPSAIPGFGLALGFTLTYLSLIVLIPLGALVLKGASLGATGFWHVVTEPRTLAALRLRFVTALIAASANAVFGVVIRWVLVRYQFPGRRLLDAFVDLPFALPTAVAGIALTALYAPNGWIGSWLDPLGIKVAYTPLGIVIALIFIGLPFVVRTVQPVLEEFDKELEEASATLGATRRHLISAYGIEYLLIGSATALFGVLAGSLAAWLIVVQLMHLPFAWLPWPALATAGIAVMVTVVLGLAGTYVALGQKPAPVLRNL